MKLTTARRDQAFAAAQTYNQFVASMQVNQTTLKDNEAAFHLTDDERRRLAALPGPYDVLVLAHDWCGDVVANLPIWARIGTETGQFNLRIVPKNPDFQDVGALYPHADGDVHIPIYVFFDAQGHEVAHFIERTPPLDRRIGGWVADFWASHPELPGRGQEFSALTPEVRAALLAHLGAERQKTRDLERRTIVAWLEANLL